MVGEVGDLESPATPYPPPLPPCAQAELNPLIGLAGYHLETLIQIRALSAIGQLLPNLIQTSFKSSSLVISTECFA